ncbi:MAG: hypothetical protein U9O94_06250 [Nanoarchaeota archaeon]|nr:hypothetical protein [Nanoarchaeota archaeon]
MITTTKSLQIKQGKLYKLRNERKCCLIEDADESIYGVVIGSIEILEWEYTGKSIESSKLDILSEWED